MDRRGGNACHMTIFSTPSCQCDEGLLCGDRLNTWLKMVWVTYHSESLVLPEPAGQSGILEIPESLRSIGVGLKALAREA